MAAICIAIAAAIPALVTGSTAAEPADGLLDPFLGDPVIEGAELFRGERFPNVLVTPKGTVLATWGGVGQDNSGSVRVRRSEDGGATWGPEIVVADPGFHGGGALADKTSGDLMLFVEQGHPPAPLAFYRSTDDGLSWQLEEVEVQPDERGAVPSMHMCEHGITLTRGPHAGRLLRPARVYEPRPRGYNTAVYSDDGGRTWRSSGPFPAIGSGEGALAELSDGRIYLSSRRNWFADDEEFSPWREHAWSHDGGETWEGPELSAVLPDGPRYRGAERRGNNWNGHFGMMAGLVRLPVEGSDILLYSNADHDGHERVRLTVWVSFDGGETWPLKRLVHERESAYSSLAAGRPGTPGEGWIYLQFETGGHPHSTCKLARFNLAWLLDGELTGDGELPAPP